MFRRVRDWVSAFFRPHQRGPVRHIFSFSISALALLGILATAHLANPDTTVFMTTPQTVAVVGEQFFIDVKVATEREVNAVSMNIRYPTSNFTVNQLREGESVLSIWTETPSASNGLISLSGGTFRRGFTGENRIIRIAATASSPGNYTLRPEQVRLLVGDGTGDQLELNTSQIESITIRVVGESEAQAVREAIEAGRRPTDLTGDGQVTMQDISIFMSAWSNGSPVYDFTGDGRMTFRDFSVILADFFRQR